MIKTLIKVEKWGSDTFVLMVGDYTPLYIDLTPKSWLIAVELEIIGLDYEVCLTPYGDNDVRGSEPAPIRKWLSWYKVQ